MMKTDRLVLSIVAVAIVVLAALCAFRSCAVADRPSAENPVVIHDTIVVRKPAPSDSTKHKNRRHKKKKKTEDKTKKSPTKPKQRDYPGDVVSNA